MKTYTVKIDEEGTKFYYNEKGQLHREDGPAIEKLNGYKAWYINGKHHREDGPSVEFANGDKCWYKNGKLHRNDGPAVENEDGYKEWWLNGMRYTEKQEFNLIMNNPKEIELTMTEINKHFGCQVKIVESH